MGVVWGGLEVGWLVVVEWWASVGGRGIEWGDSQTVDSKKRDIR